MRIEWFLAASGFLWLYAWTAKKIEKPLLQRRWAARHVRLCWLWILVGCGFIVIATVPLFTLVERETLGPGFLVWLCFYGIFAVMVGRIVVGLLKCIREQ